MLDFAHVRYLNLHADVRVEHNGTRGVFRSGRGGKANFVPHPNKSAPDYYGCIDGRMIAYDAKSTRNKRTWRLDKRSQHQWHKLFNWARVGALTWFAVEHRLEDQLYLVPVTWESFDPSRPPRLRFEEPGDALVVPFNEGWYDWLDPVRDLWLKLQ